MCIRLDIHEIGSDSPFTMQGYFSGVILLACDKKFQRRELYHKSYLLPTSEQYVTMYSYFFCTVHLSLTIDVIMELQNIQTIILAPPEVPYSEHLLSSLSLWALTLLNC
jgi:hypothetical protein